MVESTHSDNVYHSYRLNNGLQIVGQNMPEFESVTVLYYIRTGSRDEYDPSIAGVAHLLHQMIGTTAFSEIILEFNKIGAEFNAFTARESTVYYVRVLGEYLPHAFELLSDMLMRPPLEESDFETAKQVAFGAIAQSEEKPYNLALRMMMRTYFGNHPLGHDVLGTRESIRNMKLEQMHTFWEQHYVADNIIIAIAGNFDWEHFTHLVIRYCGDWRSGGIRRTIECYKPPGPINKIMVDKNLKEQIMIIAMPAVDIKDPDYYAAVLGGSILGDNDGSRLYWNIFQRGLAESASAGIWAMEGAGILLLEANSAPDEAPRVLKLLRAELENLLDQGIHEDELRRAKDKWISAIVLSSESTISRVRAMASDWVAEGRLVSVEEEVGRIENVSIDDVMRALHRFPVCEGQVLTTLGPLSEDKLLV